LRVDRNTEVGAKIFLDDLDTDINPNDISDWPGVKALIWDENGGSGSRASRTLFEVAAPPGTPRGSGIARFRCLRGARRTAALPPCPGAGQVVSPPGSKGSRSVQGCSGRPVFNASASIGIGHRTTIGRLDRRDQGSKRYTS
jgi:hypothetical protein